MQASGLGERQALFSQPPAKNPLVVFVTLPASVANVLFQVLPGQSARQIQQTLDDESASMPNELQICTPSGLSKLPPSPRPCRTLRILNCPDRCGMLRAS
jgi:hypothetical protein